MEKDPNLFIDEAPQGFGVMEQIRNSRIGRLVTAGVASLGLVAGVEATSMAMNAEPVTADTGNVPEAQASTSDLVRSCVKRELVRPHVVTAKLTNPGKITQSDVIEIDYPATPEDCRGVVQRNFQYEVVLREWIRQRGKLHRETAKMERWYATRFTQEEAGKRGVSGASAGPVDRYRCSDGKARTKLLLRNRGTIKDSATDDVVGRKIWQTPFQIIGRVGKHRHVGRRGC